MIVDTVLKHSSTGKPLNDYDKDCLFEITKVIEDESHTVNLILLAESMAKLIKEREPQTRDDQLINIRHTIVWLFKHPHMALTYKGGSMTPKKFKSLSGKLSSNFSKIFRERSGFGSMKGSVPPALGVDKYTVINLLDDWTKDPDSVNLEEYK